MQSFHGGTHSGRIKSNAFCLMQEKETEVEFYNYLNTIDSRLKLKQAEDTRSRGKNVWDIWEDNP